MFIYTLQTCLENFKLWTYFYDENTPDKLILKLIFNEL